MSTFKDNADRTWTVTISVDAIKRMRSLLDVDLMGVVDGDLLERLVSDPVLLCDVIYALCKRDADAHGVSAEEFGRAMGGDAIDAATTALLEELVGFFPSRRRAVLAKALEKLKGLEAMALSAAEERLASGELEREMEAVLRSAGVSSGSSPAPSGSTPAP